MPEHETAAQRLEQIQNALIHLKLTGLGSLSELQVPWLLIQAAHAQELRAALEGMWLRIHAFNKEWYNGGFCVLCAADMLAHSPDCAMEAARRALAAQAGSSSHGPSTDA